MHLHFLFYSDQPLQRGLLTDTHNTFKKLSVGTHICFKFSQISWDQWGKTIKYFLLQIYSILILSESWGTTFKWEMLWMKYNWLSHVTNHYFSQKIYIRKEFFPEGVAPMENSAHLVVQASCSESLWFAADCKTKIISN